MTGVYFILQIWVKYMSAEVEDLLFLNVEQ